MTKRAIIAIATWVWRNYLLKGETIIAVYSWRDLLISNDSGCRRRIQPCPIETFKERKRMKRSQNLLKRKRHKQ